MIGLIDIDDFTEFNHKNSFDTGNKLLCSIESKLNIKLNDLKYIKRLGTDEFIFKCEGSYSKNSKNLANLMSELCDEAGLTISIGILNDEESINEITIKKLKACVYIVKQNGKNKIYVE
ncbi:MAG: GGDEF domain-containing protein [Bacteroidetes bacterium]|nr:GGDEF domain-containing protein [Bacteroidota bacterium]